MIGPCGVASANITSPSLRLSHLHAKVHDSVKAGASLGAGCLNYAAYPLAAWGRRRKGGLGVKITLENNMGACLPGCHHAVQIDSQASECESNPGPGRGWTACETGSFVLSVSHISHHSRHPITKEVDRWLAYIRTRTIGLERSGGSFRDPHPRVVPSRPTPGSPAWKMGRTRLSTSCRFLTRLRPEKCMPKLGAKRRLWGGVVLSWPCCLDFSIRISSSLRLGPHFDGAPWDVCLVFCLALPTDATPHLLSNDRPAPALGRSPVLAR